MNKYLEEMTKKETSESDIELCILWTLDDATDWNDEDAAYRYANKAAVELESLRGKIAQLQHDVVGAEMERDELRDENKRLESLVADAVNGGIFERRRDESNHS